MPSTGQLNLAANRWEPFVYTIDFEGLDLTGATFAMQVRDRKDGGFVRADLSTVTSVGTEGVTLAGVTTADGLTTSSISIRINEPTMEAMGVAREIGADGVVWWDMQITPSGGVKYRALEGTFTVKAGVTN